VEYDYKYCESLMPKNSKLISGKEISQKLLVSLRFFAIKTVTNLSETAHDQYIQQTNQLLKQNKHNSNSLNDSESTDTSALRRRGLDLWGILI
jgi:hypothetical protein